MTKTNGTATAAIAICAAIAVVAGLFVSGGPIQARKEKRDETRLRDLQAINQNVYCRAAELGRLPEQPENSETCPEDFPADDPFTGEPYGYSRIDDRNWRVCAALELPDLVPGAGFAEEYDASSGCFVSRLSSTSNSGPEVQPMEQIEVVPSN